MTKTANILNTMSCQSEDLENGMLSFLCLCCMIFYLLTSLNNTSEQQELTDPSSFTEENLNEMSTRLNIHHQRCSVHLLQLCVKKGLECSSSNQLVRHVREIATSMRRPKIMSSLDNDGKFFHLLYLRPAVNIHNNNTWFLSSGYNRPKLDMETRWGSTYKMIERLCELQPAIDKLGEY